MGAHQFPGPRRQGHFMVIQRGLLMMHPGVNVERSPSCGGPATVYATHAGADFAFQSYAFQRFMSSSLLSHQRAHPHPETSVLPKSHPALSVEQLFTAGDLVALQLRLDEFTMLCLVQVAPCVCVCVFENVCAGCCNPAF